MVDKTRKWHDDCLKGIVGPRYEMEPAEGEYRCKRKDKSLYPVYFWYDRTAEGAPLRCHIDGKSVSDEVALRTWEYCGAKNCITPENYWNYIDHGKWLDNDDAAASVANGPVIDPGTNGENAEASLKAEIETALANVKSYTAIDSDELAAKAQTLRSSLTTLKGKAQDKYESWSRPLLDEIETIRKTWFPIRDSAAGGADAIKKALGAWEDTKREAARKAQAETDRKAAEHAAAVRKAEEANQPPPPPLPPSVAPNMPAPSAQIRGGSGRTASVRTKKVVTKIDLLKAWEQFGGMPEVYNLFMNLAQKAVDAGIDTPCATVDEKADVR